MTSADPTFTPDPDLAARYVAGAVTAAEAVRVEHALEGSPAWRALVGSHVEPARLEANLAVIGAELSAPRPGRIERLLLRAGVPDPLVRLLVATPVLRRSWYLASFLVLLFGLAAADPERSRGSVLFFLALAPVVPVLGVGLAYGPGLDPAHEMQVTTPRSGLRLVLARTLSVLATSLVLGGIASLLAVDAQGARVVAWLLPALALTTLTLAAATVLPTRVAAAAIGGAWLVVVAAVARTVDDDLVLFEPRAQAVYAILATAALGILVARRRAFDVGLAR